MDWANLNRRMSNLSNLSLLMLGKVNRQCASSNVAVTKPNFGQTESSTVSARMRESALLSVGPMQHKTRLAPGSGTSFEVLLVSFLMSDLEATQCAIRTGAPDHLSFLLGLI
jgi:hypothetical protein